MKDASTAWIEHKFNKNNSYFSIKCSTQLYCRDILFVKNGRDGIHMYESLPAAFLLDEVIFFFIS